LAKVQFPPLLLCALPAFTKSSWTTDGITRPWIMDSEALKKLSFCWLMLWRNASLSNPSLILLLFPVPPLLSSQSLSRVQVEVYLDTEKYHQVTGHNTSPVHFLPCGQYSPDSPPDIFVAWRYFVSLGLTSLPLRNPNPKQQKMKRILWLHDMLQEGQLPREVPNYVSTSSLLSSSLLFSLLIFFPLRRSPSPSLSAV
jgi:hypothetical protein